MKSSISVIIPVFNTRKYLKSAIDSVLGQNVFIRNIIIIDDGSTDGSGEYLDQYYGNNPLIKIIHTENFGQGHARNIGIDNATGEYIYCFDSDDILIDGFFNYFFTLQESNPNLDIFCFSGESFLDEDFSEAEVQNKNLLLENAYKRNFDKTFESGEEAYKFLIENKSYYPGPPLYIFKKSILTENNIRFKAIRYEDEEFTTNLFLHAQTVITRKDVYFKRRVRSESTMQRNRDFKDVLGYIENIKSLEKLQLNRKIKNSTKELLEKRKINFVKKIITIRTVYNIKIDQGQRNILNSTIKPLLSKYKELRIFYYKYPFKFKLNKIKERLIN